MKLAFQGELGAFSHLAALELFLKSEIKACQTFEECFKLAMDDSKYKIIIPIENSLAGRVADIHYLIPKYKLQIYAEYYHPVIHNLLGLKGTKLKDIITVRSHSQAIGQCQKIIQKNNSDYKKYFFESSLNLKKDIYSSYDYYMQNKYKLTVNQKTLNTVKNYFK